LVLGRGPYVAAVTRYSELASECPDLGTMMNASDATADCAAKRREQLTTQLTRLAEQINQVKSILEAENA